MSKEFKVLDDVIANSDNKNLKTFMKHFTTKEFTKNATKWVLNDTKTTGKGTVAKFVADMIGADIVDKPDFGNEITIELVDILAKAIDAYAKDDKASTEAGTRKGTAQRVEVVLNEFKRLFTLNTKVMDQLDTTDTSDIEDTKALGLAELNDDEIKKVLFDTSVAMSFKTFVGAYLSDNKESNAGKAVDESGNPVDVDVIPPEAAAHHSEDGEATKATANASTTEESNADTTPKSTEITVSEILRNGTIDFDKLIRFVKAFDMDDKRMEGGEIIRPVIKETIGEVVTGITEKVEMSNDIYDVQQVLLGIMPNVVKPKLVNDVVLAAASIVASNDDMNSGDAVIAMNAVYQVVLALYGTPDYAFRFAKTLAENPFGNRPGESDIEVTKGFIQFVSKLCYDKRSVVDTTKSLIEEGNRVFPKGEKAETNLTELFMRNNSEGVLEDGLKKLAAA